jgi:EAL domain-containing protein (putative c-di-GMP-specific phosphodiesterase class I)
MMRRFDLLAWPFVPLRARDATGGYELILSMPRMDTSLQGLSDSICALHHEYSPAEIDRWVLDEAMSILVAQIPLLHRQGISITLNMSGQSFRDAVFVGHLLATLEHCEVPAGLLTIQVPERSVMDDLVICAMALKRVRHAGCGISLSGFGITRRSHQALASIPATRVKIDARLMSNVLKRRKAQFTIKSVMYLIEGLHVDSIVDGVSCAAVAKKMRAFGVDFAQGAVYGNGIPLRDALDIVRLKAQPEPPVRFGRPRNLPEADIRAN